MESNLSHSLGDTTSALNRISDFNFDLAVIDRARFSKSSYQNVIGYSVKEGNYNIAHKIIADSNLCIHTPIEGRAAAAFGARPKPFFSTCGALPSPQITGTRRTPRLRRSVRNLSAFCIAKETVSFRPAKIT